MDIEMLECNGIEATKLVKSKYPQIKIIMLTVFDNDENIQQEVNKFISRKALVDPVAYSQSMKSLKSVLYAIKSGNGNNNYGNHIR